LRTARRRGRDAHRVAGAQRRHLVAEFDRDLALQHQVDLLDRPVAVASRRIAARRHVGGVRRQHAEIHGELLRTQRPAVAEERARPAARVIGRLRGAQDRVAGHGSDRNATAHISNW
jgi:hypothetical protein